MAKSRKNRSKPQIFDRVMTKDGAKAMVIWDMEGETFCALGENRQEAARLAFQLIEDVIDEIDRQLKEFK